MKLGTRELSLSYAGRSKWFWYLTEDSLCVVVWPLKFYFGPDTNEPYLEVCKWCDEEVSHLGPDGISFCENCGCVEGQTESISNTEYERRHS